MSRIGRMPIAVPAGVTVDIAENNKVTVKGPKGTLERVLPAEMEIKVEGAEVVVSRPNDLKKMKSIKYKAMYDKLEVKDKIKTHIKSYFPFFMRNKLR